MLRFNHLCGGAAVVMIFLLGHSQATSHNRLTAKWEWQRSNGSWVSYTPGETTQLEKAYNNRDDTVTIKTKVGSALVYFDANGGHTQCTSNSQRSVRRRDTGAQSYMGKPQAYGAQLQSHSANGAAEIRKQIQNVDREIERLEDTLKKVEEDLENRKRDKTRLESKLAGAEGRISCGSYRCDGICEPKTSQEDRYCDKCRTNVSAPVELWQCTTCRDYDVCRDCFAAETTLKPRLLELSAGTIRHLYASQGGNTLRVTSSQRGNSYRVEMKLNGQWCRVVPSSKAGVFGLDVLLLRQWYDHASKYASGQVSSEGYKFPLTRNLRDRE